MQKNSALFLDLFSIPLFAIALTASSLACQEQAAQSKFAFEVATIKPAAPLDVQRLAADVQAGRMPKLGPEIDASRATYTYMTLKDLIALAYSVHSYQISGPPWLGEERFDIEAKMPDGATKDDAPAMLRTLLEDRFKLVAHKAEEEQKVLALVAGKNGPKLKESATAPAPIDVNAPLKPGERQIDGLDGPIRMKIDPDGTVTMNMGARGTIIQKFDSQNQSLQFASNGVTMARLAEMLSRLLLQTGGADSRQVVDMTGLKGNYEVNLEISLADMMALARASGMPMAQRPPSSSAGASPVPEASDPGGGTSVFESVEQMGLKLEERKATVNRLVIDQVEKTPTEN